MPGRSLPPARDWQEDTAPGSDVKLFAASPCALIVGCAPTGTGL